MQKQKHFMDRYKNLFDPPRSTSPAAKAFREKFEQTREKADRLENAWSLGSIQGMERGEMSDEHVDILILGKNAK